MAKKTADHYGYLHGYSDKEAKRLADQAQLWEERLYRHIKWPEQTRKILEPGCGVGAQTEILLRRFPKMQIACVDRSTAQLKKAKARVQKLGESKRVAFFEATGEALPFADESFDGAFICFVLEHISDPVPFLTEVRRVLRPGGVLYCTEVLNASFFFHPYAPATLKYWFEFNDQQWNMGGDPFCGAKLGNYLQAAGYQSIDTEIQSFLLDRRMPKTRKIYLEEFYNMLMSAAPELLKSKKVTPELVKEMQTEWAKAKENPETILYQSLVQARAVAL